MARLRHGAGMLAVVALLVIGIGVPAALITASGRVRGPAADEAGGAAVAIAAPPPPSSSASSSMLKLLPRGCGTSHTKPCRSADPQPPRPLRLRAPADRRNSKLARPAVLERSTLLDVQQRGSLLRLRRKLWAGEPVAIAVFGGSISRGHQLELDAPEGTPGATLQLEYTWAGQLVRWLNEEYPVADGRPPHSLQNHAKGASGSRYAALHYAALMEGRPAPDLVLCELAANDASTYNDCAAPGNCRPLAVYTEELVRGLLSASTEAPPMLTYLEFASGFIGGDAAKHSFALAQHTRVCKHYGIAQWSLREALLASGTTAVESLWCVNIKGCPPQSYRAHPPLEAHRLVAEYVALQLGRAFGAAPTGDDVAEPAPPLPVPLFAESLSPSLRPTAVLDFAQGVVPNPVWPICKPPEAPPGCGPPGHTLIPGQDFVGGLRAEPAPDGWRWVDEAQAGGHRPSWVKKFGLVAHGTTRDTATIAPRPRIAFDVNVTQGSLLVGFMRSYENMGRAELSIDGHPVEVVDGLWKDRSSQYNSVRLNVDPGVHVLEVAVLPLSQDDSHREARGSNKFKLLDILVY